MDIEEIGKIPPVISQEFVNQLIESEEYDEIFRVYGRSAYKKYAPRKYQKRDLKRLREDGKYEEILSKYGKKEYDKAMQEVEYEKIRTENGIISATLWKWKKFIKCMIILIPGLITGFTFIVKPVYLLDTKSEIENNQKTYAGEIIEYQRNIEQYAKDISRYGFSDLQLFVKLMNDMWNNIKGYAPPAKDIKGFEELDLATEEGYGVCRNMAADMAKKLNAINPEYNARVITVTADFEGLAPLDGIERTVLSSDSSIVESNEESRSRTNSFKTKLFNEVLKLLGNVTGNHVVVLVDSTEYDVTVAIDITNLSIGVFMDGKMIIFNFAEENWYNYKVKGINTAVYSRGEIESVWYDYTNSYKSSKFTLKELSELLGVEAQKIALAESRSIVNISNAFQYLNPIKSIKDKSSFDDRIRVEGVELPGTKTQSYKDSFKSTIIDENSR